MIVIRTLLVEWLGTREMAAEEFEHKGTQPWSVLPQKVAETPSRAYGIHRVFKIRELVVGSVEGKKVMQEGHCSEHCP